MGRKKQILYIITYFFLLVTGLNKLSADILLNKAKKAYKLSGVENKINKIKNPPEDKQESWHRVEVRQDSAGTWQLYVEGRPYFIKGMIYSPAKIGEDPGIATLRDWMTYDDNCNNKNDVALDTWWDKNNNNIKDGDEPAVGDFQLLKEIGCNTIRTYHMASENIILGNIYNNEPGVELQYDHVLNKDLLKKLYNKYGIMVIMGNFLGSWVIGSGVSWAEGTDYTDPVHCANIKKSVKAMVLDNKDEPYVLMWLLGNENNIANWSQCNAVEEPVAYAKLVGELTEMIHELDPEHPVAVCDGDGYGWFADPFNTLREYVKYAPQIDIISYNAYHGPDGFDPYLWQNVRDKIDKPIFISEYGMFAYDTNAGYTETLQLNYHKKYWRDIVRQSRDYYNPALSRYGNCIGGVIFDWCDRWYVDPEGTRTTHDPATVQQATYSPDGLRHEEWFGIVSMGDGSDWLMRQKRAAYYYYKEVWNKSGLSY